MTHPSVGISQTDLIKYLCSNLNGVFEELSRYGIKYTSDEQCIAITNLIDIYYNYCDGLSHPKHKPTKFQIIAWLPYALIKASPSDSASHPYILTVSIEILRNILKREEFIISDDWIERLIAVAAKSADGNEQFSIGNLGIFTAFNSIRQSRPPTPWKKWLFRAARGV